MKDWLLAIIIGSSPASVANLVLNIAALVLLVWAWREVHKAKIAVARITTDGNKWLIEALLKQSYDDHFSRLYQRVDALATSMGKEFLCNPEHLIQHRGMQNPDSKG